MSAERFTAEYVVAAARADYSVAEDVDWMSGTAERVRIRYGLALQALAGVPVLLGRLDRLQVPENAAAAAFLLEDLVSAATEQLEGISEYLGSITDPGPASCRTCGLGVAVFLGKSGWQHYELGPADVPFLERRQTIVEVEHEAEPSWERPARPVWSDIEGDLPGTPDVTG